MQRSWAHARVRRAYPEFVSELDMLTPEDVIWSLTAQRLWLPVHQQACLRTAPRMRACGLLPPSWFMTSRLRHIAPGESGDSLGSARSFRCPPRWSVSVARTTGNYE